MVLSEHPHITIPFTYTFSEFWEVPGNKGYHIEHYYFVAFLILEVCVFLLIICCVKRFMLKMTANNEIFNFISGFGFTFEIPFFLGLLASFDAFNDEQDYAGVCSAAKLIFGFLFFSFSYLLQLIGLILLLFLWLKNSNKLLLFISLGSVLISLVFLLIGVLSSSTFLTDYFTSILFWIPCAAGIFFYIKQGGDEGNTSGGNYVAQPQ